tara:strand:+ start:23256 stop:24398 length:1143 start_codon:yes stop_codon:yes gene_type:complete
MSIQNILLCAATGAMLAGAGQARELSFAIGHPPVSVLVKSAIEGAKSFDEATDGDMTLKVYPLTLLSMAETSGGLREGLADVGTVMTPYFPNEFPHTNLVVESSMLLNTLGDNVPAVQASAFSGAVSEFLLTKCPECVSEFSEQNQVFTGGIGTPPYLLNCTKPIVTMEDLDGARLRIGGANWARWSQALGASPITMSGNEMLEALNQGVLDCIILSTPDLYNFGMGDSVKHITRGAPGGAYFASVSNINKDSWNELNSAQRMEFLRAMAKTSAMGSFQYQALEDEVILKAQENGVQIHDAAPDVVAASLEFVEQDRKYAIEYFASQYGVTRGEEMLSDFTVLLEKWVGLASDAQTSDDFEKLLWDEVYSKVDVETYGVN